MKKIHKIIAALCLSDHTVDVLDNAATLARQFDAELLLVNVVNVRDLRHVATIQTMGYDMSVDEYKRRMKEEHREKMDDFTKAIDFPREKLKQLVTIGHPVERILEVVKEEGADLLVIGVKGRSNLPDLLVGSVAEKLFRHSPVTVVSVRTR